MKDDNAAFMASVEGLRAAVDRRLIELTVRQPHEPEGLNGAVRHALLSPGKRFRPLITLLAARELGAPEGAALDTACAIEMVHAASLILDDLPSMDDARYRRGQPTTHRLFGEASAILAAVGLLNLAYATISADEHLSAVVKADLVRRLSAAVGFDGLVTGQAMDLDARDAPRAPAVLEALNHRKTGVLMMVACEAGARIAGAPDRCCEALAEFARRIGLAFQIRDDLIDAEGAVESAGKDVGKDAGMSTVVSTLGRRRAQALIDEHLAAADAALAEAGGAPLLADLARSLFSGRKAAA
ncbi:MAG: polyprenyl synthetase family protein [Caulobacteraceae bacterium]